MPRGYFNPAIDLNLGPLRRLLEDLRLGWDLSDQSIPTPVDPNIGPPSPIPPPDPTTGPPSPTAAAEKIAQQIIDEGIMEGFTMPRQETDGMGGIPLTAEKIAKIRAQAASPKFQEQMNVNAMQPARPIGGGAFPVSPASSGNPVIDQAAGLARGGPTRGIYDYTGPRPIAAPGGGYTGPRQVMAGGTAIPVGAQSSAPPARGEYSIPPEERFTPEQANMLNSLQPWATATTASQLANQPKQFEYDTQAGGAGIAAVDPNTGMLRVAQDIPGAASKQYGAQSARRDVLWQAATIVGVAQKDPATWTPEERAKVDEIALALMSSRSPSLVGVNLGGGAPPAREPNRVGAGQTDIFGR